MSLNLQPIKDKWGVNWPENDPLRDAQRDVTALISEVERLRGALWAIEFMILEPCEVGDSEVLRDVRAKINEVLGE